MIIDRVVKYLTYALLVVMPLCVVFCLFFFARYYPEQFSWSDLLPFCGGVVLMGSIVWLYRIRILSDKWWQILGFVLMNLVMLGILLSFNTQPASDYAVIWRMATKMAAGTFSIYDYSPCDYEYFYNWQIGIAAFESIIIRLFGPNFVVLKILTVLLINILGGLIYYIARIKASTSSAVLAYLLFAVFYPILGTCGQFSNQHIAAVLILLILILLEKDKWYWCAVAAILAGLMNVLRPMAILIVLSLFAWQTYVVLKNRKRLGQSLIIVACFLFPFYATIHLSDKLFISLEYADSPISQAKIPYFKFDKGLTGYYKPDIAAVDGDIDKFNKQERQHVIDAIVVTPKVTIIFVANKMCRFFGLYDNKIEHTYHQNIEVWYRQPIRSLYCMGWGQYCLIVLMSILGYGYYRRHNGLDIFQIFFLGSLLVYFFIEAQPSYRYEIYAFMFLFGCGSLER